LAAAYILANFTTTIREDFTQMQRSLMMGTDLDQFSIQFHGYFTNQTDVGGEIHALLSSTKLLESWPVAVAAECQLVTPPLG